MYAPLPNPFRTTPRSPVSILVAHERLCFRGSLGLSAASETAGDAETEDTAGDDEDDTEHDDDTGFFAGPVASASELVSGLAGLERDGSHFED